jgi:GDP-4-dehydro-6-deoxy-D-mannose reductase
MGKQTVLITGITGMVGSHFRNIFEKDGYEVFGIARNSAESRNAAIQDSHIIRCDILERDFLMKIFKKINPDIIIHMAAQAFNGASWDCEFTTHNTNITGTLNVLYCAKQLFDNGNKVKVLLACSSAEYGNITPEDCPLVEERLLKPHSPYGVSKVAGEMLGQQYYANYGLEVFLPRMFIHVGTGHPPATAIQNFARQIALVKKGYSANNTIFVGNLDSARDFIDVRDGVRAMKLLLEKGKPGIPINICTGKAYKISEVLEMLITISGADIKVVQDNNLFRAGDEPLLLGDNRRISELGFVPDYDLNQTLKEVFNDWMNRI